MADSRRRNMSGLFFLSWLCLLPPVCEGTCGPGSSGVHNYVVIDEANYDRMMSQQLANHSRYTTSIGPFTEDDTRSMPLSQRTLCAGEVLNADDTGPGQHPLGFYFANLSCSQGAANLCVRITAPDSQPRKLEIRVKTVSSAGLCVNISGSVQQCFQGNWTNCIDTSGNESYVEFLCDSGRQNAVSFWYRQVLSKVTANEGNNYLSGWCSIRNDEFPGDTAVSPVTTGDETAKASHWIPSSLLVAILLMLIWFLQ